jgi:hypothetical protein
VTPRDRRALLLGGLLVASAWLAIKVIPAAGGGWQRVTDRLQQSRILLGETRAVIADLPGMEDSVRAMTTRIAHLGPRLLTGATAELAQEDLAARVTSLAGWHRMAVVSLTRVPDSTEAGLLRRIRATAVLQGDFRGTAGILRSLARDSVATVVERTKVASLEPQAPGASPEKLQVELELTAWYLGRSRGT